MKTGGTLEPTEASYSNGLPYRAQEMARLPLGISVVLDDGVRTSSFISVGM